MYNLSLNKRTLAMFWRHSLILSLEAATSQLYVTYCHLNGTFLFLRENHLRAHGASKHLREEELTRLLICCLLPKGRPVTPVATTETSSACGDQRLTSSLTTSYLGISESNQIITKQTKKAKSSCIKKSISEIIPMCEVLLHDTKCSSQTSNS